MANDELLTDEYVAGLLAKEAKDASAKYSAMGLEAYNSSRPSNKLKPNTRFLRHIIKETKNHNEALLAKEAAESQARLQDLAKAEDKKRKRYKPESGAIRNRQLGDIAAILGGKKRKRAAEEEGKEQSGRANTSLSGRRAEVSLSGEANASLSGRAREIVPGQARESLSGRAEASLSGRARAGEPSESSGRERTSDSHRSRHARDRDRERSRSPGRERRHHCTVDEDESRRHRHRRHRSPDEEDGRADGKRHRDRSRSPRSRHKRRRERSPARDGSETGRPSRSHHRRSGKGDGRLKRDTPPRDEPEEGEDSDPLADIIGPAPPPPPTRIRGRGAPGSSAMDSRFSDSYDPKLDVRPDTTGGDDWDDALEALRDRAKWRQQGADRLRAAGFTDEQVSKWEKSGGEKSMDDVQWSRAGEKREWDRGKVLGDDGTIGHGAEWAE